jgi:hypothetical protein
MLACKHDGMLDGAICNVRALTEDSEMRSGFQGQLVGSGTGSQAQRGQGSCFLELSGVEEKIGKVRFSTQEHTPLERLAGRSMFAFKALCCVIPPRCFGLHRRTATQSGLGSLVSYLSQKELFSANSPAGTGSASGAKKKLIRTNTGLVGRDRHDV